MTRASQRLAADLAAVATRRAELASAEAELSSNASGDDMTDRPAERSKSPAELARIVERATRRTR